MEMQAWTLDNDWNNEQNCHMTQMEILFLRCERSRTKSVKSWRKQAENFKPKPIKLTTIKSLLGATATSNVADHVIVCCAKHLMHKIRPKPKTIPSQTARLPQPIRENGDWNYKE